jgi:hypothetical protein
MPTWLTRVKLGGHTENKFVAGRRLDYNGSWMLKVFIRWWFELCKWMLGGWHEEFNAEYTSFIWQNV